MAAPKLNTFQVNGPKRTLINSGTVPNKRVVLKGTDGKPIEKKKPALTPEEAAAAEAAEAERKAAEAARIAAEEEAARKAQEEYERQMEEYNKQMEEYNRQMEEYNRQLEEQKAAEAAAKAEAEAAAKAEAAAAAAAAAAAKPAAQLPKTVAKPAVKPNSILKAPTPGGKPAATANSLLKAPTPGAKPAATANNLLKVATPGAKPAAKAGSILKAPTPGAKPAAGPSPLSKAKLPGTGKPLGGIATKSAAASAAAPAPAQEGETPNPDAPEMSEEELAQRDAYLTQLQKQAAKPSVWQSKGFWIGMIFLAVMAVVCGSYVASENAKNERAEIQRQNIKKIMHRCVDINKHGVETTQDARDKHVDISCTKKDLQLLMKVVIDPYIQNEVGGYLLGGDPVGAGRNACLLLGLTAADNKENRDYIFETLAKKAEDVVDDKLFDWLLQRIGVSDAEGVNANLRTLAEKIAAKPKFKHQEALLASTWKVYGLRVTEEDVPRIIELLKNDKVEGKLVKTLCNCLDNILMMIEDPAKKAQIGDEIFDTVPQENLKQLGPTLAAACSPKALAFYKGKITDTKSMTRNNLLFFAFWGDDSVLDYLLELKGKAANDPKALNTVNGAIGTFFSQNRDRSDADAEKLVSLLCEQPFADTSKLRDIINKIDKDSTMYIGDGNPQLEPLKKEAEDLKKLQRGKIEIVTTLSGLHELEWVKNLLNKYSADADGDVSYLAKQALQKIKENTRKDQQTKERYQGRSKS